MVPFWFDCDSSAYPGQTPSVVNVVAPCVASNLRNAPNSRWSETVLPGGRKWESTMERFMMEMY
jgi:hypothetical protein